MAAQKSRGGNRRRRAAKAPVLELDATEIVEEPKETAADETSAAKPESSGDDPKVEETPDIQTETPAETAEPATSAIPAEPKAGRGKLIAAGVAGLLLVGAAGGAWLYRDVGASYFPSASQEAQASRIAGLEGQIEKLKSSSANTSCDRLLENRQPGSVLLATSCMATSKKS